MGCGASKKKEPAPPPPAADAAPAGYQPFKRGPFPVGVRTIKLTDSARTGRVLPVEVYYPAAEAVRGLDISKQDVFLPMESMPLKLANEVIQRALSQAAVRDAPHCEGPAATLFPAVLLCHAEFQHRRASSYLTTHLASHGFIVFTWDCPGDTAEDLGALILFYFILFFFFFFFFFPFPHLSSTRYQNNILK
jgi:predicted dienelactone hydrolase